ncbi:DUF91 domain-containing protein [Pseudanabaena sp. FACHB-2040]|uniref:DUF91 domain-containing protein n=1 Tax=Pseudanabaena sp. FACHB-2040 TaxID=2692859 RepID=UPI00168912B4|nr:DUF91 domain-containing protein [Pseudanabaena sp. FACHB-2040]MBD2261260.1 DUF91 domain-containing protein [Pseudanabaena sp. FACHB-2040]
MLRRIAVGWKFESEALLEDFFRSNLSQILGLKVVGQQYYIDSQVCDLIAVSKTGQLPIIGLKNCEDRYVVQQLTRYFDAVLEKKPFQEIADYAQPIRLLAIAPSFHKDNHTDLKYSRLTIELLRFHITEWGAGFTFKLHHLVTGENWNATVPYQLTQSERNLPSPPKSLLTMLAKCSETDRAGVMALREKLLTFDRRMQELTGSGSISYGKSTSHLCAELGYDSQWKGIALFLWLPHRVRLHGGQEIIARMRMWTAWVTASDLAHVPSAIGRTITVDEWREGKLPPLNKVLPKGKFFQEQYDTFPGWKEQYITTRSGALRNSHYKSGLAMTFEVYKKLARKPEMSNQLEVMVHTALEVWLSKF